MLWDYQTNGTVEQEAGIEAIYSPSLRGMAEYRLDLSVSTIRVTSLNHYKHQALKWCCGRAWPGEADLTN